MKRYIAFDCETTGLNINNNNLLTVCFIILDVNLEYIDKLNISLKQKSGYYISPDALEINKIDIVRHHKTAVDLENARTILLHFLSKNRSTYNLIPIGHNINFDINFIKSSGLLTESEYSNFISCNPIDTKTIAQFLKSCGKIHEKQSLSLINLCKYFNLTQCINLQHSSEYDTEMTIQLLKTMKSLVNDNSSNSSNKRKRV